MAAKGEVGPMPDFAVFADTQAEPKNVYDWLDWLEKQLPYPVIRVTNGDLTESNLKIRQRSEGGTWMRRSIPVFGKSPTGEVVAALGRKCTADYKIKPIIKHIRKACGITHGQKEITVTQWIGISYDEMQRMKMPKDKWTQHRWPLVELKMRRGHCLDWMKANGYPEPPRSACYYCPFHSDEEWRRLKIEDPEHFIKAIRFDKEIREKTKIGAPDLRMEIYLHRSCKPLDEVDFDNEEDKGQLGFDFQSECEGMCGI
jgi:3'-phosphoadenosine 5'-phosphosulfate sulfotransferase (PAPS reductase)/FAD synthetase